MVSPGQPKPVTEGWWNVVAQKIGSYTPGSWDSQGMRASVLPPGGCLKTVATEPYSQGLERPHPRAGEE